jgi:hypothetical protein
MAGKRGAFGREDSENGGVCAIRIMYFSQSGAGFLAAYLRQWQSPFPLLSRA